MVRITRYTSIPAKRYVMPLLGTTRVWADPQYDGSDSGARPDEAVSWGKIRAGAESVKVRPHQLRGLDVRADR
jgi:hypothetical protein